MTYPLGTQERPVRVAIIGAGPSGFYAAGALLQQKDLHTTIDLFDRLPAPHGLVRYGVAPDHQKIKTVAKLFDRTAAHPHFRFFGNLDFGRDFTPADLRAHYDQIIYAVGAQADRHLNIPGEDLGGSLSATEFVAWYNGHPDFADLAVDLNCDSAVVVGVGNVAIDVARILARSLDELRATDITDDALAMLATSQIKDIYILSRRGPAQVKFTAAEMKEIGELSGVDVVIDPAALLVDPISAAEIAGDSEAQKNMALLRKYAARGLAGQPRRIHFCFLVSPVAIVGEAGQVVAVRIEKNVLQADATGYLVARGTGELATLPAGLILRSVGYKGTPFADVPYDARTGTIPNQQGRVIDPKTNMPRMGEYVVGWAKRGPFGVIGTNKPDAMETVSSMVADLPNIPPAPEPDPSAIDRLLTERQLPFVSLEHWRILDRLEVTNGEALGKPRVKFTRVKEMLAALAAST